MKSKSTIFLLSLLTLCILAGVGFWFWTKTPQYSMWQLKEALKKHDLQEFQNYFDTNLVANNAVNDLTTAELSQIGGPSLLRRFLGATIFGALNPEMGNALAKSINDYVAKTPEQAAAEANAKQVAEEQAVGTRHESALHRVFDRIVDKVVDAVKPPPFRQVLHDMGLSKENYVGLTDFQTEGKLCHVGLIFHPADKPDNIVVMLELENVDEHWHVIRISNMDSLARNLTASGSP